MDDRDAERGPCQTLVFGGLFDPGHRCGRVESDPSHDPLGAKLGAEERPHVFDPTPILEDA